MRPIALPESPAAAARSFVVQPRAWRRVIMRAPKIDAILRATCSLLLRNAGSPGTFSPRRPTCEQLDKPLPCNSTAILRGDVGSRLFGDQWGDGGDAILRVQDF